jgi:fibronectin-binding autotransporter adhesin
MQINNKIKYNGGAAMMILVIFFVLISLTILIGIVTPTVREFKVASNMFSSKKAYFLAESGSEDAFYRIKNGKQISTSETLTIGSDTTVTNISTNGNSKVIDSTGDSTSNERKNSISLTTGAGIAFNYGLQSGNGGVTIDGGSTVTGNIYSNGSINAISASITGSAIAADSASLTADQSNESPLVPDSSISFRNLSASQDFAQSFQLSTSASINKVQFYIKKVGAPSDATIRLVTDSSGSPSTNTIPIGTVTLSSGQVTTNYGWVTAVFSSYPSLMPNTKYWVIIDNSTQKSTDYYVIGGNTNYANGTAKTGVYSGSWVDTNLDGYFRVYTGGITSQIGGASYVGGVTIGTGSVGDAWASVVKGASVAGNLYCTTGTNNNKSCNTSKGSPPSMPMPFSESNISEWKSDAESGGTITGNYTIGWAGGTLGNKKITGNLTVNGGGTLTLNGPLWVVGSVTVTAGGRIKLPSNYAKNSETIVSDGIVSISGGGSAGSGSSGSYLFIVSTSKCPNDSGCSGASAISVTGGAGAIAVDAQYGNVALSGGASLNAVVGNSISATGGSNITYDQGLASPSFVSGPSGGWNISSWKETQ